MSIFDRWTELDPALALRRIEAAHGSAIFDRFAYLDPQRAIHQIENALGIDIDDVYGLLDPTSIEDEIDAALEEGGDSSPEWVPANAKIYIDLVNDRAWTEADGEVAIDTLLGADANTENGWGAGEYDPDNLTADGYKGTSFAGVAFIGAARSMVVDEATIRIKFKGFELGGSTISPLVLLSADGAAAIWTEFNNSTSAVNASSNGGSLLQIASIANELGDADNACINVLAQTVTASRLDIAANGSSATTSALGEGDRPAASPIVAALIDIKDQATIQSITIYDALPNTAGLSALSETGVTNTAPHSLIIGTVGESFTRISDTEVSVVDDLAHSTLRTICEIAATDDDGNPLTYTVTDDAGGRISILEDFAGGGLYLDNTTGLDHVAEPTINFTFRATDPGGLYVEQEFTITVTA